jgi:hypothetical protein
MFYSTAATTFHSRKVGFVKNNGMSWAGEGSTFVSLKKVVGWLRGVGGWGVGVGVGWGGKWGRGKWGGGGGIAQFNFE